MSKRIERALDVLRDQGAALIDPVAELDGCHGHHTGVMSTQFPHGIKRYLSGLSNTDLRTLADIVAFNEANADRELQWHPQNLMEYDEITPLTDPAYRKDLRRSRELAQVTST